MAEIERKTKRYPTDLTDEEWLKIEPFLPGTARSGPCRGWAASDLRRDPTYESGAFGQRNKSDRKDACGSAYMMWVGLYRPVHVKTRRSQERRTLLTSRKLLRTKTIDIST